MNKIIDIIIPAYKAQDTIDRTLSSIAEQSIVDKIKVTIVNDKDGIGYSKHIKRFKGLVDIDEVVLRKNGGPGVARQIGLSKTTAPYVTFIDADDTFYNAFAVQIMLAHLTENPKTAVSVGQFTEQKFKDRLDFLVHNQDAIWMFGKMYKRDFLNKYHIQFNTTRSNEDTGFNAIVNLCANENEHIKYYETLVYIWWYKEDSITRINDHEYSYNQSFIGYTENMIYAINHVRYVQPFNSNVDIKAIQVMASLYVYLLKTKFRDKRFLEQNFGWCKIYYDTIFKDVMDRIPQEHIIKIVTAQVSGEYAGIRDILVDMTFYEFLDMLEKEEVKEEEIKEEESEEVENE